MGVGGGAGRHRIRVRRDIGWRATDADRPGDPDRTAVGGRGTFAAKVLPAVFGTVAVIVLGVVLVIALTN